ncbi:hypothetical protein BGZ83_009023 [Gryganskiella cystojenkinii]|nr:hypothetical protein BGZ83_009023 [Gryganskiella cystojenkinii]
MKIKIIIIAAMLIAVCLAALQCQPVADIDTCLVTVPGTVGTASDGETTTADCSTINTCTEPGEAVPTPAPVPELVGAAPKRALAPTPALTPAPKSAPTPAP